MNHQQTHLGAHASVAARALPLFLCAFALTPSAARAVDGVLEINQVCASGPGCFAGDSPGLPVEITGGTGHSFVLTSDLSVRATGILVQADDVTIDLNGFRIIGPNRCSGTPTLGNPITCTLGGSGVGIEADAQASRTSIYNGSIVGMRSHGVALGSGSSVRQIRATGNGGMGIRVGGSSFAVVENVAQRNGMDGIGVGNEGTVRGNRAQFNGDDGIDCGFNCVVVGNTAVGNTTDGITAGAGSVLHENVATANLDDGISGGTRVSRNVARSNDGFGLRLGSSSAYDHNTAVGNSAGQVSLGQDTGGNFCNPGGC